MRVAEFMHQDRARLGTAHEGARELTTTILDTLVSLLSQPLVGAVLGLATGLLLFFLSRSSFRRMTPEDPARGLLVVALGLLGRLAAATLVLWLYKTVAPSGFTPFALMLAGGFIVPFTYEAIRYSGLLKRPRAAGGHR
jgi:hypothetical protein